MDSAIEEVKAQITIEEALSHFGVDVPPRGRDLVMVRCPWHEDRTPSLAVYRQEGRAWCFACQKGGDVLDVTALFLHADLKGAVDYWVDRLGIPLKRCLPKKGEARLLQKLEFERQKRRCKEIAERLSLRVEQTLPKPRDCEELRLFDVVYKYKEKLDRGIEWIETPGDLEAYKKGLVRWLEWASEVLQG